MQRNTGKALLALVTALFAMTVAPAAELAIQQKKIEEKTEAYEIDVAWPQTGIQAIDDEVSGWIRQEVEEFRERAPTDEPDRSEWSLHIDYSVERNDGQVLALAFQDWSYTGGAHGNGYTRAFNYRLPGGQRIDLTQVLDGERGLARLSALAIAKLDEHFREIRGDSNLDWIRRGAGPDWNNFRAFLLLEDEIAIDFDVYQVASYADGAQGVGVPFSALSGVVREEWRAATASFDCGEAKTAVERAICAEPALARLDREVAQAYAKRIEAIDAARGRNSLRAAQRDWLHGRDKVCKKDPSDDLFDCLSGVYRTRLAELTASDRPK